ncbi:MAG: hypothetical protein ACRCX8_06510 [Sarcina sp.]
MKKIIGGLILSLVLAVGIKFLGAEEVKTVTATANGAEQSNNNLEIKEVLTQSTKDFNVSEGSTAVKFTNNAYAYANNDNDGTLYIYETEDDLIEFEDSKEFEKFLGVEGILNLIKTKNETLEVKNILIQSTDKFYLESGTMAVEFTNGSYAYTNTDLEGNKSYCFDNGNEIIEFDSLKEFKKFLGFEKVIEVVTQENKEEANFLIEEGERVMIVLKDESFITVKNNGEYAYYPDVKGNSDNSIFETCNSIKELKTIVSKYI